MAKHTFDANSGPWLAAYLGDFGVPRLDAAGSMAREWLRGWRGEEAVVRQAAPAGPGDTRP